MGRVCSQTCAITFKSQGRSLLSRQWGNEGIQWLPFFLNTSWSKQPSSGKHFEAVSLCLLLQGKNHEEARKHCSSLALSAFSSIALKKVVHWPISLITSQRQKYLSPAFQGWVCSSGIRKIWIQQGNFLKTVFKPFSYGKKSQLRDGWEDIWFLHRIFKISKEWEKPRGRCLCPLTLYVKGINCFCFRNLRVYCCVQHEIKDSVQDYEIDLWLLFYFYLPFTIHHGVFLVYLESTELGLKPHGFLNDLVLLH